MLRFKPEDYFLQIPSDTSSNEFMDRIFDEDIPTIGEKITAMLVSNVIPPVDPDTQFYDADGSDDVDPLCDINTSFWDDIEANGASAIDKRSLEVAESNKTSSVEQPSTEDFDAVKSPENGQKQDMASEPVVSE